MLRIYCTNDFAKYLGKVDKVLPEDYAEPGIKDWNTHLFNLKGKKCLLFVHALTHYSLLLYGIKKTDLKNIDELFVDRLFNQLQHDCLVPELNILAGKLYFYKTNNNKKVIGRISDNMQLVKYKFMDEAKPITDYDIELENGFLNDTPIQLVKDGKKYWTYPKEEMAKLLPAFE